MKNILLKLCDGIKGQGEDSVRVRALSVGYYAQYAIALRDHFAVALAGYMGILPTHLVGRCCRDQPEVHHEKDVP